MLDDVIPPDVVDAVCEEVREAPAKNRANKEAADGLRRTGRLWNPSEPVSDLVWMPQYSEHLAHPAVVAVAKAMLDDHLRIAQFNFRPISKSDEERLSDPKQQLKAAGAISGLAAGNPINQDQVTKANGIPPLVALLTVDYKEVQARAANALAELCRDHTQNQTAVAGAGEAPPTAFRRLPVGAPSAVPAADLSGGWLALASGLSPAKSCREVSSSATPAPCSCPTCSSSYTGRVPCERGR